MDHHQWTNVEADWEKEKEQVLGSLLGSNQEMMELPAETEVKSVHDRLSAVVMFLFLCVHLCR